MSEQKTEQQQIEEMEKDIGKAVGLTYEGEHFVYTLHTQKYLAKALYDADYRKQGDVVKDIISKAFERIFPTSEYDGIELIGILREVAAEIGAEVKDNV